MSFMFPAFPELKELVGFLLTLQRWKLRCFISVLTQRFPLTPLLSPWPLAAGISVFVADSSTC